MASIWPLQAPKGKPARGHSPEEPPDPHTVDQAGESPPYPEPGATESHGAGSPGDPAEDRQLARRPYSVDGGHRNPAQGFQRPYRDRRQDQTAGQFVTA